MNRPAPVLAELTRRRPADYFARTATALYLAYSRKKYVDQILKDDFPNDKELELLIRAATEPATVGTAAWAGALAPAGVADAVLALAPASASSELIRRGMRVSLQGHSSVTIPARVVLAADAGSFVGEGEPIQVRSLNVGAGPTLQPFKLGTIVPFTNDLRDRAVSDIETIIKQALGEAASLALDTALFSNATASMIRPAGLLDGVTALTGTTGGDVTALATDVGQLIDALASAGGGVNPIFVAAPGEAVALKAWAGRQFYPVLASAALAAGTVIAIEADSFVYGFNPAPEFSASDAALIHEEDTSPQPISAVATPNTVAAPVRNLWQTNCTAVRMILRVGWGMRATGHVQYIADASW